MLDRLTPLYYARGRKLAKSLLKDQRTSLTLWNAYAQLEKSHGRVDEVS
jgi:hypothetical protein